MNGLIPDRSDLTGLIGLALFGALLGLLWNPGALRPRSVVITGDLERPQRADWLGTIDRDHLIEGLRSGRVVVVDARPRPLFEAGHLPGSLPAFGQNNVSLFRVLLRLLDPAAPLVVIDDPGDGFGAKRLAGFFRARSFDSLALLEGGITGWRAAGLPLVAGWDFDATLFEEER